MLSAARCNLFSYSLAAYQNNLIVLSQKNQEVLEAHLRIIEKEPKSKHNFGVLKDLAQEIENSSLSNVAAQVESNDDNKLNDQRLFFGQEFSDCGPTEKNKNEVDQNEQNSKKMNTEEASQQKKNEKLIDYDAFDDFMSCSNIPLPSQLLMDDSLFSCANEIVQSNVDLLGSVPPSKISNEFLSSSSSSSSTTITASETGNNENNSNVALNKNPSKKTSDVSKWFQLFSELDPLNQQKEVKDANENQHAA